MRAGFEGMSVDNYFKQPGYSLKPPAKRQTLDAQSPFFLMAAQQLHVKTPSSNPKVSHEILGAASQHAADPHRGVSALLSCGSMAAARNKNCYTLQTECMLDTVKHA